MPHPLWEESQRKKAETIERQAPRKKRTMLDRIRPEESGLSRGQEIFMAGATPLLVGLLTGEVGTGAEIAGKALVGEHKRGLKEENRLIDFLRKRRMKAAGGGTGTLYQVRDPVTGGLTYRTREKAIDQPAPYRRRSVKEGERYAGLTTTAREEAKKAAGVYGKKFITSPEGEVTAVSVADVTKQQKVFPTMGDLTPKQRTRATKAVERFESQTMKIREGIEAAEQFMDAIKIGNPISDTFSIFKLAKTADGGGRLSDQDVERFEGSRALDARMKQLAHKAAKGTLTPENRKFMMEIAVAMLKTSNRQLRGRAVDFSRRRSPLVGIPESQLLEYLSPRFTAPPTQQPETMGPQAPPGLGGMSDVELDKRIKELQGQR